MRRARLLVAAALVAGLCAAGGSAVASVPSSAVTKTGVATRTWLDDGVTTTVSTHSITLTVSRTQGLKSLGQVKVSWSGARPTAGTASDVNSDAARDEEFSFALFECRGVDSTAVPLAQQVRPETCWTQYPTERFQGSSASSGYPAWRSDSKATAADRAAVVDEPASPTQECQNTLAGRAYRRWVPFVGADQHVYPYGPNGCQELPSEAAKENVSNLSLPSNETYGITGLDGKGSADFTIFTAQDHQSLGCSQSVPCSLVAVPIEGLSCDYQGTLLPADQRPSVANQASAKRLCETSGPDGNGAGNFRAGQPIPNQQAGQPAVDGSLWWAPSNWANRITVPLGFAPSDDACNGASQPALFYGSETLTQATTSWSARFCTTPGQPSWQHVQTPEPQARTALSGNTSLTDSSVQAVFGSAAIDSPSTPIVQAPVAVSGFGIAFDVDGTDGQPLATLRLDPRLLAKLLTESYPDQNFVKSDYPADTDGSATLSGNPLNLSTDPEFQALNPGVPTGNIDASSTLLIVNSDSDVLSALTAYLAADPEVQAFLAGYPDPWGMRVNPNYRNLQLPTQSWPLLDTFVPKKYYDSGANECLQADPQPWLPLVAAPQSRLFTIAQDVQFAIAQPQTSCTVTRDANNDISNTKLSATGRQAPGGRFMLGLVSLGDAARDGLSLAGLQSQSSVAPTARFSGPAGRTFVVPTDASLAAAARTFVQDPTTKTFPVPYATLRSSQAAYPGTTVVYADVPTKGLPSRTASTYAAVLDYAAGAGQVSGEGLGQLPAGYLPMTSANGLGGFAAYTTLAATQVREQNGGVPIPPADPASAPSGALEAPAVGSPGATTPETVPPASAASAPPPTAAAPQVATHPTLDPVASRKASVGAASAVIPVLLVVAVLAGLGAAALLGAGRGLPWFGR